MRVKLGKELGVSAGLEKKVSFKDPVHYTIERLAMVPTPECADMLRTASASDVGQMYAVQEVLLAEITEQTCGRLDANGSFVVGEAEADFERACSQESLEPVAVAYRSVPVSMLELPVIEPVTEPVTLADSYGSPDDWPEPVSEDCYWGKVRAVHSTHTTLTLNDHVIDVRGVPNRTRIVTELQRCGFVEAARAFEQWRESRRVTNISCATFVGCYPVPVGIWSGMMAKKHRLRMERSILEQALAQAE